jgi:peptide deformylase
VTERDEAFARIRQWGDPVLRTPTREVTAFDDVLARQAEEMMRVMAAAQGAGLAAPQVGSLLRLLVYHPDRESPARALVNPTVEHASPELVRDLEGCLSLGRALVQVEVPRAREVVVRARALDGAEVRIEAADGHARVLQHEIDHLDGVLMLDRVPAAERRPAVRALQAGEPYAPEPPSASG